MKNCDRQNRKAKQLFTAVIAPLLGIILLLMGMHLASTGTILAAQPVSQDDGPVTITTKLDINSRGFNRPIFTNVLEIQIPTDWPEVTTLQNQSSDESIPPRILEDIFQRLNWFQPIQEEFNQNESLVSTFTISENSAILVFTNTGTIYNLSQSSHLFGLVSIEAFEDQVLFQISSTTAPTWTTRIVDFRIQGMTIDTFGEYHPGAYPYYDRDYYTWGFRPGDPNPPLFARTKIESALQAKPWEDKEILPGSGHVTVTTQIDVSATGTDYPRMETRLIIQAPVDWPGIYRIMEYPPEERAYLEGLEILLLSLHLFEADYSGPFCQNTH
ncbi:MAG: hypothetical protein KDJ97_19980 [Anaerolineae bacterium]|nr:hypothetical protein [Anaerolineae bacterium]